MAKYIPGITVTYGDDCENTFGLFPPIICMSGQNPPTVTTPVKSPTQVTVVVTFDGDEKPFTITLNLCEPPKLTP